MIDEHKDSKCRIFLCYRFSASETAKYMKSYLKSIPDRQYGRVWYSDDENLGNYTLDCPRLIGQADIIVLFLNDGFTDHFLTADGKINTSGYNGHEPCVTVRELCEIEKQRQMRNIKVIAVNIDDYSLSERDLSIIKEVFAQEGILRDDSISFYKNLNRNIYSRRQTDFSYFADRVMKGLEESEIFVKKAVFRESSIDDGLYLIGEDEYRSTFQNAFSCGAYPIVKFFGYTGEVLSSDLLSYAARYSLNVELRILQRNYVMEEQDEKRHNASLPEGIRPWNKAKAIRQMCHEPWNHSLKRTIRYYSHQPILKGCLFCNAGGRALMGFFNFQKWEPHPSAGGSVFKSVPSDMILINPKDNKHCESLLERLNSQFEYEWEHSLDIEAMKRYELGEGTPQNVSPKVIIVDFDRTLAYLYRNTELLTELACKMCDYYSEFIDVDPALRTIDGYRAWHRLHRLVADQYDYDEEFDINSRAERMVTDFEMEVLENTPFFEDVADTIRLLHDKGIELMLVSSNSTKIVKHALRREDIFSCFSYVAGRPLPFDPDKIKPSPYPIERAISKTTADKKRIWYVGDDVVDVDSAKACGIISVGVATGRHSKDALKSRGADHVIDKFGDILSLI